MQISAYLELARIHRPIGALLLFYPCLWGVLLAHTTGASQAESQNTLLLLAMLLIGALAARGAGCVWNDITDRDIDAHVARTAARPLVRGAVSLRGAYVFLVVLLAIALAVLLALPPLAWLAVAAILPVVAFYPFSKRVFFAPQLILGVCFNWGVWVGWLATEPASAKATLIDLQGLGGVLGLLYLGGIFWTLLYDTIYALQDHTYDRKQGLHSLAVLLATRRGLRKNLVCLGLCACICWGSALFLQNPSAYTFFSALVVVLVIAGRWVLRIRHLTAHSSAQASQFFAKEHITGAWIAAGLIAPSMFSHLFG